MNNETETPPSLGGGGSKWRNTEMKRLPLSLVLFLILLPLIIAGGYLSIREFDHQTRAAFDGRESLATLGAALIHEKFDGVIDVGTSLASRPLVYQNIEKGKWNEAIKNMERVPQALPYIDAVTLFDTEGVLKARIPSDPEMVGKSFAYRDYYQGVSKEWKPYVSSAFKRAPEPKYNVVTVAVPILSSDQKVLGILLLAIKLDTIVSWNKDLNAGSAGFAYVVDKKGQLVAHPNLKLEDDLVDYSAVAVVQKLLRGEHGVEVLVDLIDNEEKVTAYAPVGKYGFGIAVVQPTHVAFAERNHQAIELALIWALVILITIFSSYRVLKDRATIKAQRDREEIFLESIGDGVVAIDQNWHITLWNKAASEITGWSKKEVIGKPLREVLKFIRERDRAEDMSFIEGAMAIGRKFSITENTLLQVKDGREIYVGDSAAPILGKEEISIGAIVVFRDTTKERETNRLRSDFAYAAHQLRTPVTEALWNLETAMDEEDARKVKESLPIVHNALESIQKLSENLVVVSEVDHGHITVNKSQVSVADVLAEVQNKLKEYAQKRGVVISVDVRVSDGAVNTDKKLFTRAIREIVGNAVSYSPRGTKVNIVATLQDKEVIIEITDTGVGIPQEQQGIIFTKFFRGSNRGSESVGSGLGLFIAKEYIEILGGKIWFTSKEGKGTTFYISVPLE